MPGPKPRPIIDRLLDKVDERGPDECWPWLGAHTTDGYASIRQREPRCTVLAHRVLWTAVRGPIPDGLTVDHVRERGCTRRDCMNVLHMELVSLRENGVRGASWRWSKPDAVRRWKHRNPREKATR